MYLPENDKCYNLNKSVNGGMVYADGLYLTQPGSGVLFGERLILDLYKTYTRKKSCMFKNIPLLYLLLQCLAKNVS